MDEDFEDAEEQGKIKDGHARKLEALKPYQYKKGQSGNPLGRPEGISLKEYARMKFRTMTDDEREEFFNGIDKIDLFKMAEGNPASQTDITTKGEKIEMNAKTLELAKEYEEKLKGNL